MSNTEIEIQVQVEKIEPLLKFLKEKGKFLGENRQVDIYYTPSHRNFIVRKPVDEWLRLREENGVATITYKNWYHDENGKSHHCDEYETVVAEMEQMKNIFNVLNIKQIARVDKKRAKYKFGKYEISIDRVKNLGDFVEVEYKGAKKDKTPKEITAEMITFLKEKKVGKVYRNYVGYPFQILFPGDLELEEF
jgi:adenylate cyclase class 2